MIASLTACGGKNNDAIGSSGQGSNMTENEAVDTNDSNASDNASATNTSESKTDIENSMAEQSTDSQSGDTKAGTKILVAYFSATGNTKKLAEYAADVTGADLYEIVPQEPYSDADLDYGDKNSRSTREMDDPSCRPAISGSVSGMEDYDIIFIAYPIWWGQAPRIISTFMENYDFSGKTIVPFCTSGSSGIGSSAANLHSLTADSAVWLDGDRLSSSTSREDMAAWINGLGLDINVE